MPLGSPWLFNNTAAFSSNLIEEPSGLLNLFLVLTITASTTSPFLTLPVGMVDDVLIVAKATSNTCATFESGDAGAGINLKDTDARSSIEQNGISLKISSDTGGEKASSDIRMQVDGGTKMKIDSTGITALQNCTDQTYKFQVDESWGVWNTNTGLAPNTTRTWTITSSSYGWGRICIGGSDGNWQ